MPSTTTTPKTFPDATETFAKIGLAAQTYSANNCGRPHDPYYFFPHAYGALQVEYEHLLAAYNTLAARVANAEDEGE